MTWPVAERTWFVSNDDEYISRCLTCVTTLMVGTSKAEMDKLWEGHVQSEHEVHADYPHFPGRLHGCNACESSCHCTPGEAECVYEGEHNGTGIP